MKVTTQMPDLKSLAKQHHAYERIDKSDFQRRARLLQAIWREEQDYPIGKHGERLYGARLEMPWAKESLANFMNDGIRDLVRCEVMDAKKSKGKLYGKPRIFNNLLSSQPLCFNLFGELRQDLELMAAAIRSMGVEQVSTVTAIEFEHSPSRGDPTYTGDRSAFDVFIEYQTESGQSGFLGIEVKYHENLKGKAAEHRDRYEEIAQDMGCFTKERLPKLREQPLQQIWRDHLLACSILLNGDYDEGAFIFLYPEDNEHCSGAIDEYLGCLTNTDTFIDWTLENLLDAVREHAGAQWGQDLYDRYLNFGKVQRAEQGE